MNAQVIQLPGTFRYLDHWDGHDRYIFDHLVSRGDSFEEAAEDIEASIQDRKDAEALPARDRALFLARRAIGRLKRIEVRP